MLRLESSEVQVTVGVIKPEALSNYWIAEYQRRVLSLGLRFQLYRELTLTDGQAQALYAQHIEKPFYDRTWRALAAGPCAVTEVSGPNAIELLRAKVGDYVPDKRQVGELRADFMGPESPFHLNGFHSSDKPESAVRERNWLAVLLSITEMKG